MSRCPLCSYVAQEGESVRACQGCPFTSGCELTRCPRCGYEWPEESQVVSWMKRAFASTKDPTHERPARTE